MSPLCETYIPPAKLGEMERFYPLHVWVCSACFLVQMEEIVPPSEIYSEYPYLSSCSDSWVEHARRYTIYAREQFGLRPDSLVIEVACNDGYLLQHFVGAGIPVAGIEPAANIAAVARSKGIPCVVDFFGDRLAGQVKERFGQPDLLVANNVLAHVPDIHGFVAGMKLLLKPGGVISMEFPHLLQLMRQNQFDTIYHEHFSYLSFFVVERIFGRHGLRLFDAQELPTHGGSLRVFACHQDDNRHPASASLDNLREKESAAGLLELATYGGFTEKVMETKRAILDFLIACKREGKRIAGYGAPGKGNTLLNYCGIRTDFLDFTVDRNPLKQGKFTPGTRIPILAPDAIREARPDFIFVLPWNLRDEIVASLDYVRDWNARFVIPIPQLTVLD